MDSFYQVMHNMCIFWRRVGTHGSILEGKHYNWAMRMDKIVYEALWRLRWVVIGKQLTLQNAPDVNRERAVNLVKAEKDDPSQEIFLNVWPMQTSTPD